MNNDLFLKIDRVIFLQSKGMFHEAHAMLVNLLPDVPIALKNELESLLVLYEILSGKNDILIERLMRMESWSPDLALAALVVRRGQYLRVISENVWVCTDSILDDVLLQYLVKGLYDFSTKTLMMSICVNLKKINLSNFLFYSLIDDISLNENGFIFGNAGFDEELITAYVSLLLEIKDFERINIVMNFISKIDKNFAYRFMVLLNLVERCFISSANDKVLNFFVSRRSGCE